MLFLEMSTSTTLLAQLQICGAVPAKLVGRGPNPSAALVHNLCAARSETHDLARHAENFLPAGGPRSCAESRPWGRTADFALSAQLPASPTGMYQWIICYACTVW
eukprot:SAG11_NODE_957_length_6394_cov_4.145512_3_plen_105_part_00